MIKFTKNRRFFLVMASIFLFAIANVSAQKNLARDAISVTATGQRPAPFQPENMIDGNLNACGTQTTWLSWNPAQTGEFIEFRWANNVNINRMHIYHAWTDRRFMDGGMIQRWTGSAWVDHHYFTDLPNCDNVVDFDSSMTSNRLRIVDWELNPSGQQSNPSFREIEFYNIQPNDIGVSNVNLVLAEGSEPIKITVENYGPIDVDSFTVSYEVNGVFQSSIRYTDVITRFGSRNISLPNYTFLENTDYTIKAWTSDPNDAIDSTSQNDTATRSFRVYKVGGKPVTYDKEFCGSGFPTFYAQGESGVSTMWLKTPSSWDVLAEGDTAMSVKKFYPESKQTFYAYNIAGAIEKAETPLTNTFSYVGGLATTERGVFFEVQPKFNTILDSIFFSVTEPTAGGTVTGELYIKKGVLGNSFNNRADWTSVGRTNITVKSNFQIGLDYLMDEHILRNPLFLQQDSVYSFYFAVLNALPDTRTNSIDYRTNSADIETDYFVLRQGGLSNGDLGVNLYTAGAIPEMLTSYRPITLSETETMDIDFWEKPIGGELIEGSQFPGVFRRGTENNPDYMREDFTFEYELTPPTAFSNSNFGSDWDWTIVFETVNGTPVPSAHYSVTNPSSSNNALISYKPAWGWADSTLRLNAFITENTHNCDSLLERYIFIAPTPVIDLDLNVICFGDLAEIKNNSDISSGFITHLWDFGDGNTSDAIDGFNNYANAGTYTVKYTATSGLGIVKDTSFSLVVNEKPNVNFDVLSACLGKGVEFTNRTSISNGTINYEWNYGDGSPKSTLENPAPHNYANPGRYRVTLKATSDKACVAEKTRNAVQFAVPDANFDIEDGVICANQLTSLTNSSTIDFNEPIGSDWTIEGVQFTQPSVKYEFKTAGQKMIKLVAYSQFGCLDSIEKPIDITDAPVASFTFDEICDINEAEFTNTSYIPNDGLNLLYTWNFGDGATSNSKDNIVKHQYNSLGSKEVSLEILSTSGCSSKISQSVNVLISPLADFEANNGCFGDPIQFRNKTTISDGDVEYTWYFGDGDSAKAINPIHIYNGSQSLSPDITLIARAIGGCSNSITKKIDIADVPACGFTSEVVKANRRKIVFTANESNAADYIWVFEGVGSRKGKTVEVEFPAADQEFDVALRVINGNGCDCVDSLQSVTTSYAVGVDNPEFASGVRIYPNPTHGVFNLEILQDNIKVNRVYVINMNGQTVESNIASTSKNSYSISGLAEGIYLLAVETENTTAHFRVVVVN